MEQVDVRRWSNTSISLFKSRQQSMWIYLAVFHLHTDDMRCLKKNLGPSCRAWCTALVITGWVSPNLLLHYLLSASCLPCQTVALLVVLSPCPSLHVCISRLTCINISGQGRNQAQSLPWLAESGCRLLTLCRGERIVFLQNTQMANICPSILHCLIE